MEHKHILQISGCDDDTYVWITGKEYWHLADVVKRVNEASDGYCQPHMYVYSEGDEGWELALKYV